MTSMRTRRGSKFRSLLWVVVLIVGIAFWHGGASGVSHLWDGVSVAVSDGASSAAESTHSADSASNGAHGAVDNIPDAMSTSADKARTVLSTLSTSAGQDNVGYDRSQWKLWTPVGRACWSTREAVLARQAQKITLTDAGKRVTTDIDNACAITGGSWTDPYTGEVITNPRGLDIDHVIPLGYVAAHGGQSWSADRKQQYANNLDTGHLLAVSASANRSKGDKGPSEWMPTNKNFSCAYASDWVDVAHKWSITLAPADKATLQTVLDKC